MQLIVATDRYLSAPERLVHSFAHALPGRWYAMAAMLNGAGALAFAARLLGKTPDALERAAADGYRGPGDLVFLPYLSGERTPLDDLDARGVLFGMSETTSPADVARATMEGVALTLADARDCLEAAGARIERVGLIGGGAKSTLWTQMIAAATGFTVVRMQRGESGPALGAARLARMAATGETAETVCTQPEIADVTEPDPELAARFAAQRQRFSALYQAVKAEFKKPAPAETAMGSRIVLGSAMGRRKTPSTGSKIYTQGFARRAAAISPKPEFSLLSPADREARASPHSDLRHESAEYQSLLTNAHAMVERGNREAISLLRCVTGRDDRENRSGRPAFAVRPRAVE